MAVISTIEPRKSKRTGDIPFLITGSGFDTPDLSSDFSGAPFYSDISVNGGAISAGSGLELSVSTTSGSIAGIDTSHVFGKVFDVSLKCSYDITTFPAIDDAVIIAERAYNQLDPTTYFEIKLQYQDSLGYYLSVLGVVSGSAVYSKHKAIDPRSVQGLKIIRSGNRFTGYAEITNSFIEIGSKTGFPDFDSVIKIFAGNSLIPVSGNLIVRVDEYNVSHSVSLVNKPATIISFNDTEIAGRTQPNEVSAGDILVGLPDGSVAELLSSFEYTEKQGLNKDTKNFDTVISVYNFYIKPSRNELFTSAGSFIWGDNYWIDSDKQNKNLYIPSLWDPVTANVPAEFLQSGYGDHDNIKLIDIKKFKAESKEYWYARINHGTYFIRNVPYYLHSSESITLQLGTSLTADGRSIQPLRFLPKPSIPISVSTLTTDIESGLIVDKKRFNKRGKFSGIIQNGIELNAEVVSNIDKTKNEFIVKYNSNNEVINWRIPTTGTAAGLYTFQLPKIPLKDFNVVFSRPDIFITQKSLGSFYDSASTIYGEVYYGEPLTDVGDYSINYATGEVTVILDIAYVDLGYVSFTFDYPAVIEFNNNYLFNKGGDITDPKPSDLAILDTVGESDGQPRQIFRLKEFPILDFSDSQYLDIENFNLFLYDESDNTFDLEWERIRDIKKAQSNQKVYQLNADQGTIFFGDGINGAIPQKYKKIVAGYKTSVRIEYEPVSSTDYWVGRDTDLNLSRNSLNSGFLYLSRKELIPDNVSIQFSIDEITALEYAELSAIVRDRDGDPVPSVELTFQIVNGDGDLEEETLITDSNGEASTTFIPSGRIEDMGIFVHLFEPGINENTLGDPRPNVYFDSGTLLNNLIVAEETIEEALENIYLFKIYDDGDQFNRYNNQTRKGGSYVVYYDYNNDTSQNELIRPVAVSGKVLIFDRELPQPFSSSEPFYEPNLRGFAIISKKQVQAKAIVNAGLFTIDSDIANLKVDYSPIQKGEWTLPIPPIEYTGSEIDRATYITINP